MRFFIKMLKGLLIGVSVVIPGVSGGTMAVSMGIYDQIIDFATVSSGSAKRGRALLPYVLGILIGIAIFSYFIQLMFSSFPLITAFLFVGLILGALPMLIKKVRGHRFRISHAAIFFVMVAIMLLLPILSHEKGQGLSLNLNAMHALLAVLLGFSAAMTMVIPGVSGSMLLMVLGYYEPVLSYVNQLTAALLQLNFTAMGQSLIILLPFLIGAIAGIVLMARGIKALLRVFPYATYYAIIALVLASPFTVLYQRSFIGISFLTICICLLAALAGFFVALLLGKGEE